MPAPFASAVVLNDAERCDLESLVRANSTPQALAFRARLVLRAAESDQPSNWQIGIEFECSRDTVSKWRRRYLQQRLPGLQDATRSGRPRAFSP
jgi:transposase